MKKVLLALLSVLVMSAAFAQAPKTTYNVTATSYQTEYYSSTEDWYCGLQDADGNQFYFDIYTTTLVSGQTYTFSDMDDYYSFALIGDEEIDYTNASFTYTVANGVESVVAMAALSNGDIYNLTYSRVLPMAEDTVTLTFSMVVLDDQTAERGAFLMAGLTADQSYYATVAVYSNSVAGVYSDNDFIPTYTWLAYMANGDTTYMDFESGNATVTATANGYALEAYLLCNDNICYHIIMNYTENGINTASKAQVSVYPNPATDVLHVEANDITRIDVIDAAGRIALTSTQNVNTINVSGLANGIYMLRTTTTEGVNVQKIVKK